ncbi:hypothetical protein KC318_g4425 [Hortaea werneckii]|nr:hypothetical protein KC334_g7945 [Hortaea werneckii]KAI7002136.1 hypothetical protein KC355_g10014 [Hortaea werneckii]KAI7669796.1 hypothetical protein KC318_g4425 [Hortaea werneckii]
MEPVLTTDHELDIQRLEARNTVAISTNDIEPVPVDIERDEGLLWPSRYAHLPSELDCKFASARLDIRKDVVDYLRDIAQPTFINEREIMNSVLELGKNTQPKPITPPLLPLSPPLSPAVLPKPLQEMELTSEPEDLLAFEAAETEQRLMAADEICSQNHINDVSEFNVLRSANTDMAGLYSGLETPIVSSSSPARETRPQSLKTEVPLLPPETLEPPNKKARTTSILEEAHLLAPEPDSDIPIANAEATYQSSESFFSNVAMPAAEKAMRAVEDEELKELDTVARVVVPHLDDEKLIPPWEIYSISGISRPLDKQIALMALIKKEHLKHDNHWSGVSKLERLVKWDVFPSRLGRVNLDEQFDDDKSAERYVAKLNYDDEIDIQGFVTKLQGLRLLDPRDDDEEKLVPLKLDEEKESGLRNDREKPTQDAKAVVPATTEVARNHAANAETAPPERDDLSSLLQRRKVEFEKFNHSTRGDDEAEPALSATQITVSHKTEQDGIPVTLSRPSELFKEGGIEGFLRHQGGQSVKARYSKMVKDPVVQHAVPAAVMVAPPNNAHSPDEKSVQMPNPMIVDGARSMQVSRWLKLPQAEDSEADISISPRSGLLITTLQKLKQRPLPGQKDFFSIRHRITAVSRRYEKLFVLISEGRPAETLDERDAEAITGLLSFAAAHIATEVEIKYVPGELTVMCEWIAGIISSGNDAQDIKLLAEETTWERFLRVAGLNAFAAQVISAKLQKLRIEGQRDVSSTLASSGFHACTSGLSAFVSMSVEERVQLFGPLLGGDFVLRKASEVVDGLWSSAQLG